MGAGVEDLFCEKGKGLAIYRYDMVRYTNRNIRERRRSRRCFEAEPESPIAKFLISSTEVRNGR